jgi:uncharacterized protein (DUF433 family)
MGQTATLDKEVAQREAASNDSWSSVVWVDPERVSGTPCFTGTRVPIQTLWDYLAGGHGLDVFLDHFPTVSHEQAVAAVRLAGERFLCAVENRS